jgi:hypothetical protein
MKYLQAILLLMILVGCGRRSTPLPEPTATATGTLKQNVTPAFVSTSQPSNMPTSHSTASPSKTPTFIGTSIISSSPEQFTPNIIKVCPSVREVELPAMHIPPEYHLLIIEGKQNGGRSVDPFLLFPDNSVIKQLDVSANQANFGISPDYRWFSFYRSGDNEDYNILWVSSIDGSQQWPVIQLHRLNYAKWVSDDLMVIMGSPDAEDFEKFDLWDIKPFMAVNPFTKEQQPINYSGWGGTDRAYYDLLVYQDRLYLLIYEYTWAEVNFYLYDHEQDSSFPVFKMLKEVEPFQLMFMNVPIWFYDMNKYATTVAQEDGIDLAMGLDLNAAKEIEKYEEVMTRILLPEHLMQFHLLGIAPNTNWLLFQHLDFLPPHGPLWGYTLDYPNRLIRDYCYDLDIAGEVKFSPDGRFIAFTQMKSYQNEELIPYEKRMPDTIIMSLETGLITQIPDFTSVGWVINP